LWPGFAQSHWGVYSTPPDLLAPLGGEETGGRKAERGEE